MYTAIVLLLKRPIFFHLIDSQDWLLIDRSLRIKHRVNVTKSAYNTLRNLILPHFAQLLTGEQVHRCPQFQLSFQFERLIWEKDFYWHASRVWCPCFYFPKINNLEKTQKRTSASINLSEFYRNCS